MTSSYFSVSNGVRQGGILSPYLFTFYINNLSVQLNQIHVGCYIGSHLLNHLMYADDIVLISPSVRGMDKLLKCCEMFADEHDMLFNTLKSVNLNIVNSALKDVPLPDFFLNGSPIPSASSVKYLGHIFNTNCLDNEDIQRQRRVLCASANSLIRKFYMCSPEVKLKLFTAFCSPLYTSHLWWNFHKSVFRKFQTQYNSAIKRLLNFSKFESTSLVCSVFCVRSCQEMIRHFVHKFMNRLSTSPNVFISQYHGSISYMLSPITRFYYCIIPCTLSMCSYLVIWTLFAFCTLCCTDL